MESPTSIGFSSFSLTPSLPSKLRDPINTTTTTTTTVFLPRTKRAFVQVSSFSYQKFIDFALEETNRHTHLQPSPLQEAFGTSRALDGKTDLKMLSYRAPKIRLIRSLNIQGSDSMQVLDFAVFPEPEYDLPIFCANFFTASRTNIVVLDLNPLYDVTKHKHYKEKYYESLLPLGAKYIELLPWGGKLTSESIRFFSPIVIWTKFASSQDMHEILYTAFMDYFRAWVNLMDRGEVEDNASRIAANSEAQHRYLTWREEKDPGHQVLKRLIGEADTRNLIRNFLFDGIASLGSKTFLDYFPEYGCEDGSINEKRSMLGKSYANRPWNARGEFIGDNYLG